MKLVSFQTLDAAKELVGRGRLVCDARRIDLKKAGPTYEWVLEKMRERIASPEGVLYPLWCWVKFKQGICPPKHKGERIDGFDVKITFCKPEDEVFVTDFRRYSFLLSNLYIPDNLKDKMKFDELLERKQITHEELKAYVRPDKHTEHRTDKDFLEVCELIRKSFDKCITEESDALQGCVWDIKLSEVEKIEFLPDDGWIYGSFNYKRSNGKRFDWVQDYYKQLK